MMLLCGNNIPQLKTAYMAAEGDATTLLRNAVLQLLAVRMFFGVFSALAWGGHLMHIACATKAIMQELHMSSLLLHILKASGYTFSKPTATDDS
jgi:hypothetical protein